MPLSQQKSYHNGITFWLQRTGVSPCSANVARMPDETDAKKILTTSPSLRELEKTTRTPRTTWMKTIQQDLKFNNHSLNEAIDVAQNSPLCRLMSTFGATHSWWLMP